MWGESLLVEEISQWEECLRRARAIEREVRKARRWIERCPNLRKAYRVVEGCFGTTISVRQGAEYASLSKTAFEQRFAKVVGLSFHRFLVLDGLSRAIGRLESGDDPVTSVALEAGFTLGSLEYNFRRHLGCCSPSAYRKAHRSQPRRGAIVGRIEPRVAAGRSNRAARTEAEDASGVVARRALAADPKPITPNAAGPFVPPAAVSDLPELLCRICSERRLFPEESCSFCPFRSAPATAPSAERSGQPSGDPFPSPPDPVDPVEPAADPAQAQSRLERAILGGTLVEMRDRLACRSCCAAAWELIRTRFADAGLTLERAARACGVSPRNLNRRLRERVGWSFHRLLTRYRVLVAAERMLERDDTLVRIAQATGFDHVSNLTRHFRKVTGCVPRGFSRPVR